MLHQIVREPQVVEQHPIVGLLFALRYDARDDYYEVARYTNGQGELYTPEWQPVSRPQFFHLWELHRDKITYREFVGNSVWLSFDLDAQLREAGHVAG